MNANDLLSTIHIRPSFDMPRLLKWSDKTIARVQPDYSVIFEPDAAALTGAAQAAAVVLGRDPVWSPEAFRLFLQDRLPSRERRDIESILRRCKLAEYDVLRLAAATRAISPRDPVWLAFDDSETHDRMLDQVFKSIFFRKRDLEGGSVLSPEGVNIKRYAVSRGAVGILKKRLHPYSTDVQAEVAVYHLARLMNVDCCAAWLVEEAGEARSFSRFEYDVFREYIVHVRRLFRGDELTGHLYRDLLDKLPQFKKDIQRMVLLDFVTRQDDRHLSNMALKVFLNDRIEFYPLYDNGRSLFFEDPPELMREAATDIKRYSTSFGEVGTYYDVVMEMLEDTDTDIGALINTDISDAQIRASYETAGLNGEKLECAVKWTSGCLAILRKN